MPTSNSDAWDPQIMGLWHDVRRGLTPLLFASASIGVATFGVLSTMAERYTSEAQLQIVAKSTNPFPDSRPGGDSMTPRLDKEAINTHARALMAPDLLLTVADGLKLRQLAEFNSARGNVDTWTSLLRMLGLAGPRGGESEEDRVLAVVTRQLEVAPAKDSRFIPIRFTSTDPQLSADFANRLAETYRAGLVSTPVEETTAVVNALMPKVEALRREVLDAESEVERYRSSSGQFRSGTQSTPLADQRMASLNDELLKAETARSEAEARWRAARELTQSGSAEIVPEVQKSPLIQGLVNQRVRLERQLAEASATLLPGHPRMRQFNADLAGLKQQITNEVQKVVQGLEKDVSATALRIDAINRQLAAFKTKAIDQSGNEATLKALESTAQAKRTELERLQKQLEDNRTVVNTRQVPVEAQLLSLARPNSTSTFPKKGSTTALAMLASMILGLALLITRGLLRGPMPQPVRSASRARSGPPILSENAAAAPDFDDAPAFAEAQAADGLVAEEGAGPPYGTVPAIVADLATISKAKSSRSAAPSIAPPMADLVERLAARTDMASGIRTLVTSERPGVEVNAEAVNLAEALSRAGKSVVLVVWSLSGQGLPIARTTLRKPGLVDLLEGKTTFEQVVGRIPGSKVHVIQPGAQPTDMHIALDPDRLNLVLDALDEAYEQIVVAAGLADAAPLFEAIEGRFDAAVVVGSEPRAGASVATAEDDGHLLGFEVNEIDIVRLPTATPTYSPVGTGDQRGTVSFRRMAAGAGRQSELAVR